MTKRPLYTPDLQDFILCTDTEAMLTDACKSRILHQFLMRFRQEFDTELEFMEALKAVIQEFEIHF